VEYDREVRRTGINATASYFEVPCYHFPGGNYEDVEQFPV
jgi:hypothetical protein